MKLEKKIQKPKKDKQNEKKQINVKDEKAKKDFSETGNNNLNNEENKNQEYLDEDEFNPTLAAMEQEIKPKIISIINILSKSYTKLIKSQSDKLNCALNDKEYSRAKERNYQKNAKKNN